MNLTAKQYGGDIWSSLKVFIIEDIKLPESKILTGIADALTAISNGLMQNASVRSKLNQKVENLISFMVEKHGDRIVGLISDKIRKWDLKKTSQIMELEVGKDLQYIRISGTVVGGSVGLIIYALFVYLPALIH